jgi:hypothetical protein
MPKKLDTDAREARSLFRRRRLDEPKDAYLDAFRALERANETLVDSLSVLLGAPVQPSLLAEIVRDKDQLTALRYVGAPPISEDDLETMIEGLLSWTRIRDDPQFARRLRDVIRHVLDPKRFPWVSEGRAPTPNERAAAILASAVAAACQRVQTGRRIGEKKRLEGSVRDTLRRSGLTPTTGVRRIANLRRDGPSTGTFAGPCVLGGDEADIVACLFDHRILAIECKASNSEINSRKRINKELGQDARNWTARFGRDDLVVAGVIEGVFNPQYLVAVQDIPVVIYWGHRLGDLQRFVKSTNRS